MKRIDFYIGMCFMTLLTCLSSCSKDNNNNSDNSGTTTPVQVKGSISREVLYDGTTNIDYSFNVLDNGVLVNNATITVNGVNVPRVVTFFDGYYDLTDSDTPSANFVPGTSYTVNVQYGGKTYTETLKAPGGFTANNDYTKISWQENGTIGTLDVAYLYGSSTYSVPSVRPKALSTPQTIPASAYPSTGKTYTVDALVQNIKDKSFGTLSGDNCYFLIKDFIEWHVTK